MATAIARREGVTAMLEQEESRGPSAADESSQPRRKTAVGAPFLVEVDESHADQVATVRLVGELDMSGVDTFARAVTQSVLLDAFVVVTLDFERLVFLDSTGLGALIAASGVAHKRGIRLEFRGVHSSVRRLFEVTGTLDRFGVA
jgi:anti-anti-sigma factor